MRSYPEESNYNCSPSFLFGLLCKIRHKSNLTSLPIQDLKVFFRAYLSQLGLKEALLLMDLLFRNSQNSDDIDVLSRDSVAMMIYKDLHAYGG